MKMSHIKILRYIFLSVSILLISIFSIFHFVLWVEKNIFPEWGAYVSIVLDVSKSMNVEDVWSQSRLTFAKNYIYNLMQNNPGYQYALTIFAWESQRVLPFTSDINLLATFLPGVDSRNITKQGTNIPAALSDGISSFWEEKTGVLLLISDGDESQIELGKEIREEIKNKNLASFVIGVWSEQWGYVPSGDMMSPYEIYNGQRVIASLNKSWLKSLARDIYWDYRDIESNIIDFPYSNGDNGYQNQNSHSLLVILSFIFWILFLITLSIEIYFSNFVRYE